MRASLILATLVACGPAAKPPPVTAGSSQPPPPAKSEPRQSREAMVRATIERLGKGDLEGLMSLADMDDLFARAVDCSHAADKPLDIPHEKSRMREHMQESVESCRGLQIEVLEVVPPDPDAHEVVVKAGAEVRGCTAKADVAIDRAYVRLRVKRGDQSEELRERVRMVNVGDRWYLDRAPSHLASHEDENPPPPDEKPDLPAPPDVAAPPKDAKKTAKGVFYKVLSGGSGGAKPTATDTVRVHYTGWTTDGKMFDSSLVRGTPAEFPLNGVIAGWTDGMQQVAVGQKVRMWIPEDLAYKGMGRGPQGMLVFDVELLDIVKP